LAAPAVPIASVAECITVEAGAIELMQAVKMRGGELVVGELTPSAKAAGVSAAESVVSCKPMRCEVMRCEAVRGEPMSSTEPSMAAKAVTSKGATARAMPAEMAKAVSAKAMRRQAVEAAAAMKATTVKATTVKATAASSAAAAANSRRVGRNQQRAQRDARCENSDCPLLHDSPPLQRHCVAMHAAMAVVGLFARANARRNRAVGSTSVLQTFEAGRGCSLGVKFRQ
jgi:hypothetical protein